MLSPKSIKHRLLRAADRDIDWLRNTAANFGAACGLDSLPNPFLTFALECLSIHRGLAQIKIGVDRTNSLSASRNDVASLRCRWNQSLHCRCRCRGLVLLGARRACEEKNRARNRQIFNGPGCCPSFSTWQQIQPPETQSLASRTPREGRSLVL